MVKKAKQHGTTTASGRLPINQMSDEQLASWIAATRAALVQKMQRERAYLDRRVARGTHTPTDDAYEHDQRLEADLLALLSEMAASLGLEGMQE
jgi:hypothetical protein